MKKLSLLFSLNFFLFSAIFATDIYNVDLSKGATGLFDNHLNLGTNVNLSGDTLNANSFYFSKNGKPWYPVMGEIHYSRLPEAQWEESIIKMKLSGIDIIASYVFWIYHEEEKGVYNWSGDRNLRKFAELCKKHNVHLFLRIGPWCHGEVRNGGLPDWVLAIEGGVRRDNPAYLEHVKPFFKEINKQVSGLYFKDNGPIVGAQIENEYRFNNSAGLAHIFNLKKMAIDAGIDVPFYSATGWPGSNLKQNELIPVWGAYPEAPWSKSTKKLPLSENYMFGTLRNDPAIGNDLLGNQQSADMTGYRYPYATAEMGGGNQITYHRRPIITSEDVASLAYVKIGSGANLMGYYMYHGGSNKIGKYSTLQESKATKYPNDYPIISYDFLSPLGEWAQIRESYKDFKMLHLFLNDYGDRLATMHASFSDKLNKRPQDNDTLRMGVRSDGKSGFIFISNYQRQLEMKELNDIQFNLIQKDGKAINFPQTAMTVEKDARMILPFNMEIEDVNLLYATVQPLCILQNDVPTYVFFNQGTQIAEMNFEAENIEQLKLNGKKLKADNNKYLLKVSGSESYLIEVKSVNGKTINILTLTNKQARNAWKMKTGKGEVLCISDGELIHQGNFISLRQNGVTNFEFYLYPSTISINSDIKLRKENQKLFAKYKSSVAETNINVKYNEVRNPDKFIPGKSLLPNDDRLNPLPIQSSGPQYQVNFKPVEGSAYWQIDIPAINGNVSEAFLVFDYQGDTGSLYENGQLVADDFYSGLPMTVGLKHKGLDKNKSYLFQIVPFEKDRRKVFFEENIASQITETNLCKLQSVKVIPQYQLNINIQ
ncbi:beta-galactosidase [Dysgonomonas sp. 216]|uniref:beta-galactosidase n=1 Tax=Dysgonomonas sp. 216 TaxID=2302934 RepID=UPI0013D7B2AF|nr:beta-galactosidase [Dysgonomonas sp. 216]NDW18624.1 beta-galactosidase [Dysgonomonas sp. 216]